MGQRDRARLHLGLVGDRPRNSIRERQQLPPLPPSSKTGKSTVTVKITMTDTGYTFTLPPKEVTVIPFS